MEKKDKFRIGEVISYGWDMTKKNWPLLVGAAFISFLVSGLFNQLSEATRDNASARFLIDILNLIITGLINLGAIKLVLNLIDNKKATLGDLFKHTEYLISFILASILYGLIVALGLILLIIPGFYWAVKYQFAFNLIVDKKMAVIDSLKESARLTEKIRWQIFMFDIACLGIMILGGIIFGVGLLLALPIVWVANSYLYRKLLD